MTTTSPAEIHLPAIVVSSDPRGRTIALKGRWNLRGLAQAPALRRQLNIYAKDEPAAWDLRGVDALDSAGAFMLWRAWGDRLPERLKIRPEQERLFARWRHRRIPSMPAAARYIFPHLVQLGRKLSGFFGHLVDWTALLGQLVLDLGHLARRPRDIPWREISATIYETGVRALGITALVGFLIGVVVSYLSALQLQTFGASIYIVNVLGLSIIRELGPMLATVLVAGRSGSAMTARLGVMRLTQELDALSALGISHSLRLVLPKVAALVIVLPLLVVWTGAVALLGGAISAQFTLDIGYRQFFLKLPEVVPAVNLVIGLGKSAVFGLCVALIACHFGLRIKPNTESLSSETTNSVVAAITVVILVDAVFGILFQGVGLP